MNNNFISPVDSLVQENNNDLFYADEKMHHILENGNLQSYLDYIKNKNRINKSQEVKQEEVKQEVKQEYKKQMLDAIWTNIENLENTIKKFKNIK